MVCHFAKHCCNNIDIKLDFSSFQIDNMFGVKDPSKHLHNSPQCPTLCSDECFYILDHASTTFQLKIKEAIHIQWEKPTLNHQLHHVN